MSVRGERRPGPDDPAAAVERAFREERAAVLATLIRHVGDFQLAEDAVQDAFAAAVGDLAARRRPGEPRRVDHRGRAAAGDRSPAPRPRRSPTARSGSPS